MMITWIVIAVVLLILLPQAFYVVRQQTGAIVERFGRFTRVAGAGLNLKIPFIDRISGRVSLRVQQLDVNVETKTKDNVFVRMMISVQYFISDDKNNIRYAFYKLNRPQEQITSYVFDVVRAEVPKLTLDEVFVRKDDVANAVKEQLTETIEEYGYSIVRALVTDIDPDQLVKESMNRINAAERLRVAAEQEGEADKIKVVKAAEADAESKRLSGEGIANQRKAIADGLRESVESLKKGAPGATGTDLMSILMMNQFLDTSEAIAKHSKSNVLFMPYSPGSTGHMFKDMVTALYSSNAIDNDEAPKPAPERPRHRQQKPPQEEA